jgi:hypothetical protein
MPTADMFGDDENAPDELEDEITDEDLIGSAVSLEEGMEAESDADFEEEDDDLDDEDEDDDFDEDEDDEEDKEDKD